MGGVASTMAQGLAEATGLSNPASAPPGGFASVAGNIAQTQMGMQPTSNPVDAINAAVTGPQSPADQEDADQGNAQAAADAAAAAAAAADNSNSMSEAATADASADSDGGSNGDSGDAGGDGDGGGGGGFARGGSVENHEHEARCFANGGEIEPPENKITAYKLFQTKKNSPGKLFPLYVNADKPVPVGKWIAAEEGPIEEGKVKSSLGKLAYRPGWHAGDLPVATHIGRKSREGLTKPDYRPDNHVWAEVEMPADVDWQSVADQRASRSKSGDIIPKTAHITDQIPHGGFYRYKTNSNMTGNWLISGGMKVNRILSDDEVKQINDQAGVADLPRLQDLKGSDRYADGGEIMPQRDLGADPTVQRAMDVTRGYQDPPTKLIEDWQWKSLPEVQQRLGGLREIPSHVQAFGNYMDEIAKRAGNEGLSARDLIKAYTITRASIQRRANDVDRVRAAGLDLPKSFTGKIRPEGAFGEWLHTRPGQDYLDSAERGEANEDAIANAVKVMTPFGKHEKDIPDALRWAAANLPGKEQVISTLVANAMRGASEPAEWRTMANDVRGIGPSKAGFLASLMGRGDQPTLDARQIIEHTGRPTSEAQAFLRRKGGEGATEAVERLSARQRVMDLELPEELKPYYQHLAHHAVWDKAANEVTTHEDVMNAMRGAASGGEIDAGSILSHPVVHAMRMAGLPKLEITRRADGGSIGDDPTVQRAMDITRQSQPSAPQMAAAVQPQAKPVQYKSWDDVPTINPQDLVGKRVFPIFADLTKAGSAFTGIDASQVAKPEQLYGGPGYPLLPESQEKGLAWAVEGKGRGSAKIRKDADYVVVSSMMPHSHQSNASFSNALMKNMDAYVRDKRLAPEDIQQIDDMIRRPTEQKELQGLQEFPGFAHPEAENFLRGISFEQRKRISNVLASKEAQNLGAPNIDKITRETLDPEFSGVPSRHGMFLLEIPKGSEDEQLVNFKAAGLPEHPSYQYGIKGRVVGKFHYPVAPEVLFKDWFDKAHVEASQKEKSNVRRAFDLAMPVGTVTQEIADMLPRHPRDIQSGKAARLALNAFNDQWAHTDDPVNKGGIGAAEFSQALQNSDFSSTLSQYSAEDINKMRKDKNFTGYKLKDGEIYFGLKRNTNYADDYGFEHPELSPNETALVSVVNNEPGAKGIGGAPVVLKAIQEGATALDCYAVPSQKHPEGFLPSFYSHFNFKELGRIPFDPQYVTQTQFDDMKHQWRKSGWDETMGMPSLVIMKWDGKDGDRSDAVRRFVSQSSESARPQSGGRDVRRASRALEQGAGSAVGESRIGGQGDASPDRGPVRADRNARPADRFTRTLSELRSLSPEEARHFGLDPAEVEALRQQFLPKAFGGSTVDKALRLTAPARPMVALADLFQRQLRGRPPS
jgi:hypothetical protein